MASCERIHAASRDLPARIPSDTGDAAASQAVPGTATAALAAGLTACGSDDDTAAAGGSSTQPVSSAAGGSSVPAAGSPGASAPTTGGSTNSTGSTGSTGTTTGGSGNSTGSGGSSQGSGAADQPESGVGQSCGTNDLDFLVTPTGTSGYLLVTATAQPGITCHLDGGAPLVLFSSAEKTKPYPAELMTGAAPDSIKVSGSTHAYAVLIPNTTRAESAVEFEQADVTLGGQDSHTAHVTLPGTYSVDEAAVTGWYATPEAATPDAN